MRIARLIACYAMLLSVSSIRAQDWPQWRGANRDGKATGFKVPESWPKEPTKKWKETVGSGVATPALVGDKLYVFTQQSGSEITRCLNAADGKEVWQDKYDAQPVSGIGAGFNREFAGTRSSPAVADGKVVTLGARGILSCLDAATGKKLWRKEDYKGAPQFNVSSSPIIADGLCVAQLGGPRDGVLVAYEMATGNEKWKWNGDSPAYASLALLSTGGMKLIIAETQSKIVAVNLADGKPLWETSYSPPRAGGGGGRAYNASTPMAEGEELIYAGSGRGTKAVKLEKKGDALEAKELWSNPDNSVQFNTPVVRDGVLYALSAQDTLYCINAKTGKTGWTTRLGGGGGGGRQQGGYGSVVDAGPVLMVLTPRTELIIFEPGEKEFKQLAKYKVGDSETYAYPVVSGNRVFVKDKDSVTLWTIE